MHMHGCTCIWIFYVYAHAHAHVHVQFSQIVTATMERRPSLWRGGGVAACAHPA